MTPQPIDRSGGAPEIAAPSDDIFTPLPVSLQRAFVLGPLAGFGVILLATGLLVEWQAAGFLASVGLGAILGGGKLMILAGSVEAAPLSPWALAALLVYIDLSWSLIVIAGLHQVYRVPGLGRWIARARDTGTVLLRRNPWMGQLTWISLAGFVALPFNGTGSVVGAVLGRLLGLTRWGIVSSVGFGSAVGSMALAIAGDLWAHRIDALAGQPWLGAVVLLTIIAVTTVLSRWAMRASDGGGIG